MTAGSEIREQWVRVPDVARHLNVSVSWINKAVLDGTLPVHRVGRNLRFRLSEIDAWMADPSEAA